jgi:hypothetical protein
MLRFPAHRRTLKDGMNSADLTVFQSDLDSARVERSAGEDVPDNPLCKLSAALVSFQNYRDREPGMDIFSALAVHIILLQKGAFFPSNRRYARFRLRPSACAGQDEGIAGANQFFYFFCFNFLDRWEMCLV